MKSISLLLLTFILSYSTFAQYNVQLRNLWAKPQVHVLFGSYTISFTIKDINKALVLIAETGDSTHPLTSGLDEAVTYTTELYPDSRMEYHIVLQPLLQNAVGAFLLTAGHAEIKKGKRKKLKEITIIIEDITPGEADVEVKVYDPANKKLIFMGRMRSDMYNKDLGID